MTVLDILVYPDTRLKQECAEVERFNGELRDFIEDLTHTMLAAPGCVGVAAPQVGKLIRAVLVDVSSKKNVTQHHGRLVLINPLILEWDGYAMGREGCLSVPDYTGNVIRAERITLEAYDVDGMRQEYRMEGFEARAVQHELDHLDGMLFLDRVVSRRSDLFRRKVYQKPKDVPH